MFIDYFIKKSTIYRSLERKKLSELQDINNQIRNLYVARFTITNPGDWEFFPVLDEYNRLRLHSRRLR